MSKNMTRLWQLPPLCSGSLKQELLESSQQRTRTLDSFCLLEDGEIKYSFLFCFVCFPIFKFAFFCLFPIICYKAYVSTSNTSTFKIIIKYFINTQLLLQFRFTKEFSQLFEALLGDNTYLLLSFKFSYFAFNCFLLCLIYCAYIGMHEYSVCWRKTLILNFEIKYQNNDNKSKSKLINALDSGT